MPANTILICHHFEPYWEDSLKRFQTCFKDFQNRIIKHIKRSVYDEIIITRFEDYKIKPGEYDDFFFNLENLKFYDYSYGWETYQKDEDPDNFVEGGAHSEVVLIPDWLRNLSLNRKNVHLCGAFEGECIEDMEIALKAVAIKYKKLKNLIVG
jgi:hypothetical protein